MRISLLIPVSHQAKKLRTASQAHPTVSPPVRGQHAEAGIRGSPSQGSPLLHTPGSQSSMGWIKSPAAGSGRRNPDTESMADAVGKLSFEQLDLDRSGGVSESEFVKLVRLYCIKGSLMRRVGGGCSLPTRNFFSRRCV